MSIKIQVTAMIVTALFSSQTLLAFVPFQQGQKVLALTEFYNSAENGQGQEVGQQIYTQITESLQSDNRLQLRHAQIEKPEFATLETVVSSGSTAGADAILVGAYSQIGGMTKIDAQLIDVASREVLLADTRYLMQGDNLSTELKSLARELQKTLVGDMPVVKEPVEAAKIVESGDQLSSVASDAAVSGSAAKAVTAGGSGAGWLLWTAAGIGVAGGAYLLYNAINTNSSTVSIQIPLP